MKRIKNFESKDSLGDIYAELFGMATRADGHYHSSASTQELYEDYRVKNCHLKNIMERREIVVLQNIYYLNVYRIEKGSSLAIREAG